MNFKKDNRGIAKSAVIIIIAIVAALAIGGAIFASIMMKKDPLTRLITGYMKTYGQRDIRYEVDASLSLDKDNAEVKKLFEQIPEGSFKSGNDQVMDFVSKILPKIGLKYNVIVKTNEDPLSIGANISILYDGKELADAGFTARPWETTVFSKALLNKPLYADYKNQINEVAGVDISNIKLKDYLDVLYEEDDFTKNFASSKYVEILKEKFKNNITSEGSDKVVLSLNYADSLKILEDIFNAGAKDEALKSFVLKKFDKLVEVAVKNGDYKLAGLSEEDFKKQAEEGKKQLSDNWETILTEAAKTYSGEEFKQATAQLGDMPIKYIFTFKDDVIAKIDGNMSVQGIDVKFAMTMEKYSEDGFTFADASNSDSLTESISSPYNLLPTLMGKANEILTGDAYKNMEADIIKTAKESLSAEDAAAIEAGLKQASSMAGMSGN
ncbi:MAG: hypothetical protein ACFNTU_01040 [Catonella sp.]